jgi:hypothetical protein
MADMRMRRINRVAQMHLDCDNRRLKMARPNISVFYHDQKSYECPECKVEMDRAHVHGWFWICPKCKQDYPLYRLQPFEVKEEKKKEGLFKGFMGRIREAM